MNKVAIVTGGTGKIGSAICKELINKGYNVISLSRGGKGLDSGKYCELSVDINNNSQVYLALQAILKEFKQIDLLVNCAGVISFKHFSEYTEEDYNNIFNTNVKAAFMLTQKVMPYMDKGYIINIGSTRSITSAPGKALYSMSKFALRSMTQSINCDYKNIRSTLVCPGAVNSKGVKPEVIAKVISTLVDMPEENNVPEIVIGGML